MKKLALAYRLGNQPEKALILFKNSLEIKPSDPFALLELASLYDKRGMERSAGRGHGPVLWGFSWKHPTS